MDEKILQARTMVIQYAGNVAKKNINDILNALTEDVQFKLHNSIDLEGKSQVRDFYDKSFAEGNYTFNHEFLDEKVVADLIFINGKQNKKYTPVGKQVEITSYDFFFILKKEAGELKLWQLRVV
tara:strand:- start:1455 stop:1826 length:372 start_codon:yes stop_codon:yes gene_type:complete